MFSLFCHDLDLTQMSFHLTVSPFNFHSSFQIPELWAEHKQSIQSAVEMPSQEVREGLVAAQTQFQGNLTPPC